MGVVENDDKKADSATSKFLELAIKKYQFDIVGWVEYCIDNTVTNEKELPVYREKPFESLLVQDKFTKSISTPPLQKVYNSQETYIDWLNEEYARDQAFYEAILKNPQKLTTFLTMDEIEEDNEINEEINKSAADYLKVIETKKVDEELIIKKIAEEDWQKIKMSQYPKVQLGIILGTSPESVINNFAVYFFNQLKSHFVGSNTAFMSSTGPASWNEMEKCRAELRYFREHALNPSIQNLLLNDSNKQ